tara:strand:- start:2786 stop:3685 length:900 start_codon:yes stop_codon:yes gene_type:complete
MAAVTSAVVGGLSLANSAYQGRQATKASERASDVAAQGQQGTLDYLRSQEAKYEPFRMQGLEGLSEFTQNNPGMSQEELIAQAQDSPLYGAIMAGQDEGEAAVLRNAGATGKMRSGNVRTALSENARDFSTRALVAGYDDARGNERYQREQQLQQLQFLAGGPNMTGQVSNQMNSLSTTQAQGIMGTAQTRQAGNAGFMNTLTGLGSAGFQMNEAGMFDEGYKFSDIRLKQNIKKIGEKNGHNIYSWIWKPCARLLGLKGKATGCLAHEVYEKDYTAIGMIDGFLTINYSTLGLEVNHA